MKTFKTNWRYFVDIIIILHLVTLTCTMFYSAFIHPDNFYALLLRNLVIVLVCCVAAVWFILDTFTVKPPRRFFKNKLLRVFGIACVLCIDLTCISNVI